MTPRRNHNPEPLLAPQTETVERCLFRGVPPVLTSNLAVRTALASTPFATRQIPTAHNYCYVAREFTRQTLQQWKLSSICDDTVQIASELVANAVRHGQAHTDHAGTPQTAVWLALTLRPHTLLCVVRDPGRCRPRLTCPSLLAERHRGLPIVDALSATWGWTDDDHTAGKSVWARLSLPA